MSQIPVAILDQHLIALGKTRSGKSSKLRVLVERLLKAGEPVCIIDVKGDWWGIKSSADGKHPGYPLVIFGGRRADMPLNPSAGKELAELIFTGNRPCVIDLRGWSGADRSRFFIDFASTAYRINKGKRYLVIAEVHNFAFKGKVFSPQAGEMLHWANTLASEGSGLGITLLADSQRGQKVHNDFLTSMETLIACKVIHKSDRDAIKDWIDGCADPVIGKQVLDSLAQLKKPDAWVWCPEIDFGPKIETFPMFETFDSFKPQTADTPVKLQGWADVNLDEIKARLETVVKQAEDNDPTVLKKRIKVLEAVIKGHATAAPPTQGTTKDYDHGFERGRDVEKRRIPALEAAARKEGYDFAVESLRGAHRDFLRRYRDIVDTAAKDIVELATGMFDRVTYTPRPSNQLIPPAEMNKRLSEGIALTSVAHPKGNGKMPSSSLNQASLESVEINVVTPVEMRVLNALAELEVLGSESPPPELIAAMAGYGNIGSKGFRNAIGALRSAGLIEGTALTEAGRARALDRPVPTSDKELQERLVLMLGPVSGRVLNPLIDAYPRGIDVTELASRAGYENVGSKGFRNALGRLRTLGFVDRSGPTVTARPMLFLDS